MNSWRQLGRYELVCEKERGGRGLIMRGDKMSTSMMPHLILPGHRSIVNQTCYSRVHHVLASSGVEKIIKVSLLLHESL